MSRRYSPEFHAFMREYVLGHTEKEIVAAVNQKFNFTVSVSEIHSYKHNHRLKSGTKSGVQKGKATKLFPAEVLKYVLENHAGVGPKEMTERLNNVFGTAYSRAQIKAMYKNRGLSSGLDGRFQKGNIPPNKGKKGMKVHENSVAAQFKKGNAPYNRLPVGTVIKRGDGYLWRKVGPGARDWKQEHKILYESVFGPIPKDKVVIFLNGNREDVRIENLRLVSKQINRTLNAKHLRSHFADATVTGIVIAELMNLTAKEKKEKKHEK